MNALLVIPGIAPEQLQLACPPAPSGQTTNALGDYDMATVSAAVHAGAAAWVLCLLLLVAFCYQGARGSLGPSFVKRWWLHLLASIPVGAAAMYVTLVLWPTAALANSCQSDPRPFPIALPADFVMSETLWAAFFAFMTFALLSIILTATLGRLPSLGNGFFHNRGCPLPRVTP